MNLSPNQLRTGARMMVLGLVVGLLGGGGSASAGNHLKLVPESVVGADRCSRCHEQSVKAWRGTLHFYTLGDLHKTKEAAKIVDKMGISSIRAERTSRTLQP